MQPKPLIFLDFDGVLHPVSAKRHEHFSCAKLLEEALQDAQCEIVISSSWRFRYSLDELREILPVNLAKRVTATTGAAHVGKFARHAEIQNFADTRPKLRWIALDDCAWAFPTTSQLIVCNPNNGLTFTEVETVRQWLTGDSPK
jgi:predicted mannosyl-3-phosphoglycerate phosphatase (HAD superfamily)